MRFGLGLGLVQAQAQAGLGWSEVALLLRGRAGETLLN